MATNFYQKKNNAFSTLLNTITNVQTTIQIQSGDTSLFPNSGNFPVTVFVNGNNIQTGEIMLVTGVSGNTFTVTRGQEGSSAQAFTVSGSSIVNVWMDPTAGVFQQEDTAINNLENTGSQYVNQLYTDTGTANAYVITPSPAVTSYAKGQVFLIVPANANTGASTLNVSALGTKAVQYLGQVLLANQIVPNMMARVVYDGTAFQLQNPNTVSVTATVTASQTSITSIVDVTNGAVTINVPTGRSVMLTWTSLVQASVTGDRMEIDAYEGSTQLQQADVFAGASAVNYTLSGSVFLPTPSAGAHTYKLRAVLATGTGSMTITAGSSSPLQLTATLV